MNTALEYSRRIYVSTNFSCNLNCVYCFEKNKNDIEFNVDEAVSTSHDVSKMQAIQKWYPIIKLMEENLTNG